MWMCCHCCASVLIFNVFAKRCCNSYHLSIKNVSRGQGGAYLIWCRLHHFFKLPGDLVITDLSCWYCVYSWQTGSTSEGVSMPILLLEALALRVCEQAALEVICVKNFWKCAKFPLMGSKAFTENRPASDMKAVVRPLIIFMTMQQRSATEILQLYVRCLGNFLKFTDRLPRHRPLQICIIWLQAARRLSREWLYFSRLQVFLLVVAYWTCLPVTLAMILQLCICMANINMIIKSQAVTCGEDS